MTHAAQCGWHCDQIDDECDCGSARPATIAWAKREAQAARDNLDIAEARFQRAREQVEKTARDRIASARQAMNSAEQEWWNSKNGIRSSTYEGRARTDELRAKAFEAKATYDAEVRLIVAEGLGEVL